MQNGTHSTIDQVILFSTQRHDGQTYAEYPMTYHLEKVAQVLADFGFTDYVDQATAWLHDIFEDTDATFEEVESRFGTEVALNALACTGVGENRKVRNEMIYARLAVRPGACKHKCADRIANVEMSVFEQNFGKARMYLKEQERFGLIVEPFVPLQMFLRLQGAYRDLSHIR